MKKWNTSLQATAPVFEKIGELSKLQRLLICGACFLILIGSFVYFSYLPKIEKVKSLEQRRSSLERKLADARNKAKQLKAYREKMKKAQNDFRLAKKVLPEKKEIPSLLTGVSRSGKDAGLEFLLFQPRPEARKDFYAEIPVSIKVTGGYHNVTVFFDNVSRLYRIVNIRDINMKAEAKSETLTTTCTAVTYKFVEPVAKEADSKKRKRKKRRK